MVLFLFIGTEYIKKLKIYIMRRVKTFDDFVNENLKAVIGSPIKYTKIN